MLMHQEFCKLNLLKFCKKSISPTGRQRHIRSCGFVVNDLRAAIGQKDCCWCPYSCCNHRSHILSKTIRLRGQFLNC